MTLTLKFPYANAGRVEGISDAGIETFTGDPLEALAREQGQNSGDARKKGSKEPVKIKYELLHVPAKELPGFEELQDVLAKAEKYWDGRCVKTMQILRKATKALRKPAITCLRISDRNTTGLTGSDLSDSGNWIALTKGNGVTSKLDGAGGSYGIGKNAFFANSVLRTVFFSTHDENGLWAFQGVTNLVSHPLRGKMTERIGYLGDPKDYLPIRKKNDIPKHFRCNGVGTDIYIVGFDAYSGWQQDLMAAFAENFPIAIHNGLIEVAIQREDDAKAFHELTSVTLGSVIQALANSQNKKYQQLFDTYNSLISPEAQLFEAEIDGLGKVDLRLLKQEGAQKRIAMFRKTGMKIFEKDRFRTPIEFAGVFQCHGEEGNSLLRRLEPPSHDKWEPKRHLEDPAKAKRILNALNDWIRQCVASLQVAEAGDIQSLPGLERFLPDDFEDEFDKPEKANVEGDPRTREQKVVKGVTKTQKIKAPVQIGDDIIEDPDPNPDPDPDPDPKPKPKPKPIAVLQDVEIPYRTFHDAKAAKYRMMARFERPGAYDISFYAIGDDGKSAPVSVADAKILIGGKTVKAAVSEINKVKKVKIDSVSNVEIQFASPSAIPRTMFAKVQRHD